MQRWLQIENSIVTNVVVWDGNIATWTPPQGALMLAARDGVDIGYHYDAGADSFTAPPARTPE